MSLLRQQPKVGMGLRMPEQGRRQLFRRAPADPGINTGDVGRPPGLGSSPANFADPGAQVKMAAFRKMLGMGGGEQQGGIRNPMMPNGPGVDPGPPPPAGDYGGQPGPVPVGAAVGAGGVPMNAPPQPAPPSQDPMFTKPPLEPETPKEDRAEGGIEESRRPQEMSFY